MTTETHFIIFIDNKGYTSSLEFGKVYRVIPDKKADKHKMLRVIDESGEDYLYPQNYFVSIQLPPIAQDAFMSAR
jgi:hypothetical protein